MLQSGAIQRSQIPYASSVLLVKKKYGTWHLCLDYCYLNAITVKKKFPILIIEELLVELKGASILSKLDLRSGYHQVLVFGHDILKTIFSTHLGHYEFNVMSFKLTNAPATF